MEAQLDSQRDTNPKSVAGQPSMPPPLLSKLANVIKLQAERGRGPERRTETDREEAIRRWEARAVPELFE